MEGHKNQKVKANRLDGTALPDRFASLVAKMAQEAAKPGSAFHDEQASP
jgi:hypothetical protein